MIVTFFGHAKRIYSMEEKNRLREKIESLIKKGVDEFLLGGYGNFDMIVACEIARLKEKYPNIKSTLVIPYLNRKYDTSLYDDTVYPDIENALPRMAIWERNKWMIKKSNIVICYVEHSFGGAYTAEQYAKKNDKSIINLALI